MTRTRFDAYRDGAFTIPANDAFGFERVETDDPASGVTFTWKVSSDYVNSAGNLQGGVLAAFADAVLGATCAAHLPEDVYPALAEMKISFLRPVPAGTTITGRGRVLKSGKRLLFVEAEITGDDGTLLAKVTGTEIPAPA
ncbi:MAG: PaaI family thioesterase [Actinomycetota bacterium]|nr:PaaI family thioesterase [Actinomycetota bacterium]